MAKKLKESQLKSFALIHIWLMCTSTREEVIENAEDEKTQEVLSQPREKRGE